MKSFLKIFLIVSLVVFVVANVISFIALQIHAQGSYYKPAFVTNTPATHYDYIIIGASTGLTTIDTKQVDSITGKKGINLSMDDTSLSSNYLMLQHFLALGNTADICVVAPSIKGFDDKNTTISANDYRFAMVANQEYVAAYFNTIKEKNTASRFLAKTKYLPAGVGTYFNAEILFTAALVAQDDKKRNRFDAEGNYAYPVRKQSQNTPNLKALKVTFSNSYLSTIKSLCEANSIEPIWFVSPIKDSEVLLPVVTQTRVINQSNSITDSGLFYDAIHVNANGRKIASRNLALWLLEN